MTAQRKPAAGGDGLSITELATPGHDTPSPFAISAMNYYDAGFQPIRAKKNKSPLDPGVTGWNGQPDDPAELGRKVAANGFANIGLRLTGDLIGIDVDAYKPEGLDSWYQAIDAHGEPPATWISTSRELPSGIRLYRWPVQVSEDDKPGDHLPGIESLHRGHRHMMVSPSIHPEGREYRWIGPGGEIGEYPTADDIPQLPDGWVEHFRKACKCFDTRAFFAQYVEASSGASELIDEVLDDFRRDFSGGRHDATTRAVARLHTFRQWPGYHHAREEIESTFLHSVTTTGDMKRSQREAQAELDRMWRTAEKKFDPIPFEDRTTPTKPKAQTVNAEPVGKRLKLTPASEIKTRQIKWLWTNRIPMAELTTTVGYGGTSKSTVLADLTAQVTRGTLDGELFGQPRNVIIIASEDSWSRSVVPRLIAAGADLTRVFNAEAVTVEGEKAHIYLPANIPLLEEQVREIEAAVLILDPILSVVGKEIDNYKSQELRDMLEPLTSMADRQNLTVIGNMHFNKMQGADALQKVSGASAWVEVPRAVIAFAFDDQTGTFVMSQVKSNYGPVAGPKNPSVSFSLEDVTVETDEGPSSLTRIVWGGMSDHGVNDLVNRRRPDSDEQTSQYMAGEMIQHILRDKEHVKWSDLEKAITDEKIASGRTARRARDDLKKAGVVDYQKESYRWFLTPKGRKANGMES